MTATEMATKGTEMAMIGIEMDLTGIEMDLTGIEMVTIEIGEEMEEEEKEMVETGMHNKDSITTPEIEMEEIEIITMTGERAIGVEKSTKAIIGKNTRKGHVKNHTEMIKTTN